MKEERKKKGEVEIENESRKKAFKTEKEIHIIQTKRPTFN